MASLKETQIEAAREFVKVAIELLKTEKGVHAETAVAGMGRMAGTFLFRSFGFPLTGLAPGQAVLSEKANEAGPRLLQILGAVLTQLGVTLDGAQLSGTVASEHQPLLAFLETQRMLESPYARIKDRLGLSYQEAAEAAVVATALLMQQCASVLDPQTAFGIAAYGFVEGSKTAPDPVAR